MKLPLKVYGFRGTLRLLRDFILTRIFDRNARLIRRPVYIRGRRYISIGKNLTTGVNLRIDAFPISESSGPIVSIGKNVEINDYVHIAAVSRVSIGNNVLIASKVFISDHNHGKYNGLDQDSPYVAPGKRKLNFEAVTIGDNVWLGEYVTILPGVEVGSGSIIGAMSVVTKNIPSNSIAIGCPAKVIKVFCEKTNTWEKV